MENAVYILKVKCTEFDDGINEGMRTIHGWLEWDLSEWNVIYWNGEDWGKSKFLGDGMSKDFELGYINYQLDSCGSHSLRWLPTIPIFDLLIFISLCSLRPSTSSVVPGLVSVINRTWKKCWCVCASVSHHLPWGHQRPHYKQLLGEAHMVKNWGLLPAAVWTSLEVDSPEPQKTAASSGTLSQN